MDFSQLSSDEVLSNTSAALSENGIIVDIVENKDEAKEKVKSLIPKDSEVMTMTSITLEQTGILDEIEKSGNYKVARQEIEKAESKIEKNQIGAAPEYSIASVHAVTKTGQIVIASNTGSQIPAAAYGAEHVIFVVGTQKIVENLDQAMERINYIIPKESVRARAAYGLPDTWNTFPSKILIINREVNKGRIHLIFVKEALGF